MNLFLINGIKNLNLIFPEKNFCFEFINKKFYLNKFIASYFSKKISSFLISDSTITNLRFNYEINKKEINFLKTLIEGEFNFNLNEIYKFLLFLSNELKNEEFFNLISQIIINEKNYLEIFQSTHHKNSISFIFNNFLKISNELINNLNVNDIIFLFEQKEINNFNEEEKFNFLFNYYNKNQNYERFNLFLFINFNKLNKKNFLKYLKIINFEYLNKDSFDLAFSKLLNFSLYNNENLIINETFNYNKISSINDIKIDSNPLIYEIPKKEELINCDNGILSFFKDQLIEIKCNSSSINSNYPNSTPDKALTLNFIEENDELFLSQNLPNQWLQINFPIKTTISSYLLKYPNGVDTPSNFVIETSMDENNWNIVDTKSNVDLRGKDNKFNLSSPTICKFIRIRNTGKNIYNNDILRMYYIEFFGSVYY